MKRAGELAAIVVFALSHVGCVDGLTPPFQPSSDTTSESFGVAGRATLRVDGREVEGVELSAAITPGEPRFVTIVRTAGTQSSLEELVLRLPAARGKYRDLNAVQFTVSYRQGRQVYALGGRNQGALNINTVTAESMSGDFDLALIAVPESKPPIRIAGTFAVNFNCGQLPTTGEGYCRSIKP